MKAIIYTQESTAIAALDNCTANIERGELQREGSGSFADPPADLPYTVIIKHPTEAKWALVADEQAEALLGITAEELGSTWYPQNDLF